MRNRTAIRWRSTLVAVLVAPVLAAAGCGAGAGSGGDEASGSPPTAPSDVPSDARQLWSQRPAPSGASAPPGVGGGHRVTGPLTDPAPARFELLSDVARISVRSADLGTDRFRISTPVGAGLTPEVTDTADAVRLALRRTGPTGSDSVTVQLSARVRWHVRLTGGAGEQVLDLSAGPVDGVELAAGAGRVELSLPRPEGTVPVRVAAGAGRVDVRAPADVPVRVTLGAGAGLVTLDGRAHPAVAGGTVLSSAGWADAADRFQVDAPAGVAALTVHR